MEDKQLRDRFYNASDRKLRFTEEDRNEVFEKIHKLGEKNTTQKSLLVSSKKFAPLTVSLLVVSLCMFLFLPLIFPGGFNEESHTSDASVSVVQENEFLTSLISVKSKEMDNRIYLNLLLTYSKDKKMMKVVSLPYDTYAPVADNNDGTTLYDKLLFSYSFGGAENVSKTVSKLVDLPIDYYAVIDLETITTLIDSMNGIDYDLQEDIRVRAISQVAFEFEKGAHRLNGEEVVALMMAATEGISLDEEVLLNLMNAVMDKAENEIPQIQIKELFTQIEANVSLDSLLENPMEINTIKSISLSDGMISDSIILSRTEGKHIYKFEKDFLNSVSEELTTFN
ncbi:LCP family protein [Lysinibacillus sp. NPDC096418]|uniref:LCP family protein n=1 Tax=Lysinibacillus sp. NPDC096418 TaxID=3364138 RepID=UPI00381DCD6E